LPSVGVVFFPGAGAVRAAPVPPPAFVVAVGVSVVLADPELPGPDVA
jgi:hypothetical protein